MDCPTTLVIWVQDELRHRASEHATMLSAGSRFADAAEIHLAKITERREDSTYDTYRPAPTSDRNASSA